MIWLLLACAKDDGDSGLASTIPDLPGDPCGAGAPYLPLEQMGEVVLSSRQDDLSLSASTINILLKRFDLGVEAQVDVETYLLRYTTQDRGELIEATAFVSLPVVDPGTEVPVVLWLHPTVGFSDSCAPTALGLEGAALGILWASQGYAVVSPDYLGMRGFGAGSDELHPYIVAEATAIVSLDAVRGAQALTVVRDTSARLDSSRLIHWGLSEGGFAALWTDRYQGAYLPEYTSIGVLAVIPPSDPVALAERATRIFSDTTYGVAAAMVSMQQYYRGPPLTDVLMPDMAERMPIEMAEKCADFELPEGIDGVEKVFSQSAMDAAQSGDFSGLEPWQCYLQQGVIRESNIERLSMAPVLMLLAEDDDLAWAPPTRQDIAALCGQGYEIEHFECAGAGHVDGGVDSLPQQLQFVARMVAGEELVAPCVLQEPVDCAPE
ncbi:MAG: hypothetical protein ACI9VR_004743 [Cognaticolwellia sp.]|jgi:hypothetical protein